MRFEPISNNELIATVKADPKSWWLIAEWLEKNDGQIHGDARSFCVKDKGEVIHLSISKINFFPGWTLAAESMKRGAIGTDSPPAEEMNGLSPEQEAMLKGVSKARFEFAFNMPETKKGVLLQPYNEKLRAYYSKLGAVPWTIWDSEGKELYEETYMAFPKPGVEPDKRPLNEYDYDWFKKAYLKESETKQGTDWEKIADEYGDEFLNRLPGDKIIFNISELILETFAYLLQIQTLHASNEQTKASSMSKAAKHSVRKFAELNEAMIVSEEQQKNITKMEKLVTIVNENLEKIRKLLIQLASSSKFKLDKDIEKNISSIANWFCIIIDNLEKNKVCGIALYEETRSRWRKLGILLIKFAKLLKEKKNIDFPGPIGIEEFIKKLEEF